MSGFRLVDGEGFDVVLTSARVARFVVPTIEAALREACRRDATPIPPEVRAWLRDLRELAEARRAAVEAASSGASAIGSGAEVDDLRGSASAGDWLAGERTLSTTEAASRLGVSDRYVRELIDERSLPATKTGRTWRVPVLAVEALRAERERTHETESDAAAGQVPAAVVEPAG